MAELTGTRQRIQSIDLLRGLVIVIMALDHVRDYFHEFAFTDDPTNMATTTPVLFFTRWITHFCAPVFVFLAGTSGFLQSLRKSKKELSLFLLTRGLWLVFAEFALITLAWTFDFSFHVFILQVIWAIGTGMIILALLVWLPFPVILIYGLLIVLFHNLADIPERANNGPIGFWWNVAHANFYFYPLNADVPGRGILFVYAFLPWSGVMALGYCFGKLYSPVVNADRRKKLLVLTGIGVTLLFVILRLIDKYGDPGPWASQPRGTVYTLLSFLNTTKYPPSLMYLCMTLGPAILLLAFIEKIRNRVTDFFVTFGRVPFFFYILHLYLIHAICVVFFFASGRSTDEILPQGFPPFLFRPAEFGFHLWVTYVVWIAVIFMLYPLCKKYDWYKSVKRKKWTSYL